MAESLDRTQAIQIKALRRDVDELIRLFESLVRELRQLREAEAHQEFLLPSRHTESELNNSLVSQLENPAIDSILDAFGNTIAQMLTSGPSAVNNLLFSNAATGSSPEIGVDGTDADIDVSLAPKGTGKVTELGTALALGIGTAAPDTSGLAGATKTWADALTAILQSCRVLS